MIIAYVIYGGDSSRDTKEGKLLSWRDVDTVWESELVSTALRKFK